MQQATIPYLKVWATINKMNCGILVAVYKIGWWEDTAMKLLPYRVQYRMCI